jgi:putative nucleotidyltransferase with HDIG domain
MCTAGGIASAGGRGTGLLTWPFRHIRWKIILPYAVLTALLAAVGSYLATDLVTGSLSERFDNQLVESARVTGDAVVQKERFHLEGLRTVSFTDGVAEAAEAGDTDALRRLVEPIAANKSVERVEVLSADGARLLGLRLTDPAALEYVALDDADSPVEWPLVQSVLSGDIDSFGDKRAQIVTTSDGLVLYTAGPIYDGDELAGVALVGTSVESLVKEIKAQALADVTVYDFSGAAIGSTFSEAAVTEEPTQMALAPDVAASVLNGQVIREERTVAGRGYDLLYGRLQVRNEVVGLYSAALPTNFIFSAANTTRTQIVIVFGVGIAAVIAIGLYLTHRLTAPILRLVRTAQLVAAGDLTARSGVNSPDEIGVLATSFDDMTERLQRQHLSTIRALTSAIDARDPYTLGHSVRVGQLSMMIGRELDLNETVLARLEVGGYLHDIGKIGIRDAVLLKPGALTADEREVIREHPTIGLSILEAVDLPAEVIQFVAGHHERLDGSGYPKGLRGFELPVVPRIAAVADMYDAITTERPYRGPMDPEQALALLRSEQGRLLDPKVVEALAAIQVDWERRRAEEASLKGIRLPQAQPGRVRV